MTDSQRADVAAAAVDAAPARPAPLDAPRSGPFPLPWRWLVLCGGSLAALAVSELGGAPAAAILFATCAAAGLSSIAGFAFSAICGALLFHLSDDPVQVVQIMITCSIANQAAMVWSLRRRIDWRGLSVYFVGGAFGLPIGIMALLHADRYLYTTGLGVFLFAYGGFMLLRRPVTIRRQHPAADVVAGFLGGITGGAVGFPGAPVTIWCGLKGWDKDRQRAAFQPFILVMQVVALVAIGILRGQGSTLGVDAAALLCVPGSLLGTAIGMLLYRRLSDAHFARAINLLLIISGVSFVL